MKNFFPYEARENQDEAIGFIEKNLGRHVCINASTGFGKTPVILSTLLKHREGGGKVIWLSRTGNETDRPIEELKAINEKFGTGLFGLSFRGKKDMCLLAKDELAEGADHTDVNYFCKARKKECKYYNSLRERLDEFLIQDGPKLFSELLEFSKKSGICPYNLQYHLLGRADVISINYNQVLNEEMSHSISNVAPFWKSFLVVDEAHNLQFFASGMNSKKFSVGSIENSIKEALRLGERDSKVVAKFMEDFRERLSEECGKYASEDEFRVKEFLKRVDAKEFSGMLPTVRELGNRLRRQQLAMGKLPHSSLYHFASFWEAVVDSLDTKGIAFIIYNKDKPLLEVWDMRSKEMLKDRWGEFKSVVFSSGTLEPMDAFADVVGLEDYAGKDFHVSYGDGNVRSIIASGLTTKGERMGDGMRRAYLSAIEEFVKAVDGNLIIFSASYRIQEEIVDGVRRIAESRGRKIFVELKGMEGDRAAKILGDFRRCASKKEKGILCATMQGRFCEGIDLPGKDVDAVFVVGIPFDSVSIRTRLYLRYYRDIYGDEKGRYYAYVVPALRRVSQALGRALRSQDDKAVFVLGDQRYLYKKYFDLLPKFVRETFEVAGPAELGGRLAECSRMFR